MTGPFFNQLVIFQVYKSLDSFRLPKPQQYCLFWGKEERRKGCGLGYKALGRSQVPGAFRQEAPRGLEETKTPQKVKRFIREDSGTQDNRVEKQRNKSKTQEVMTCQRQLFSLKMDKGNNDEEDLSQKDLQIQN